jgi:hypothetical protein
MLPVVKMCIENSKPEYNKKMRTRSSLAALLSLLLVSAPVSAWACDLSCTSHQAHSDCHSSVTTSNADKGMSMPPGMDMGSDQGGGPMGPNAFMSAAPGHSMSMSPHQDLTTQRFELATNTGMRTGAIHDHSMSVSSCTHETCSQVSTAASPPRADLFQPSHQLWMAIRVVSPDNLHITFNRLRLETPPSKMLAPDHLTTTLRI